PKLKTGLIVGQPPGYPLDLGQLLDPPATAGAGGQMVLRLGKILTFQKRSGGPDEFSTLHCAASLQF
ncbi:MAG: hypothetical protein ACE5MH_11120, partial [Terriglobia bacterium]